MTGRHSQIVLAALACLAVANGVFVGLAAYGILAAALHVFGSHGPGIAWGLAAGALIGLALLAFALREERILREGEFGPWQFAGSNDPNRPPILARLDAIVTTSSLVRSPSLWVLESPEPNAFAVGRSREEAAIVLTSGLLDVLGPEEEGAVLAHQVARIEADDIRAVGLADAIVANMRQLAEAKNRFLWSPRRMAEETLPFLGVLAAMTVLAPFLIRNENAEIWASLASLVLVVALVKTALLCWPGLVQIFLFAFFFGPLSLVEMALAAPTALVLSRLVSRTRVYAADARALQLTRDQTAMVAALDKLRQVERSGEDPGSAGRCSPSSSPPARSMVTGDSSPGSTPPTRRSPTASRPCAGASSSPGRKMALAWRSMQVMTGIRWNNPGR